MSAPSIQIFTESRDALLYGDYPVVTRSVVIGASQTLTRGHVLGRKNQIWTLTHDGTSSGDFTLTVDGEETAALDHEATAAQVQAAIEALDGVHVGDVVCTGGPLDTAPVVIQFKGRLAGKTVAVTQDASSVVDGTTTLADTAAGTEGQYVASEPDATDGSELPVAILAEAVTTGVGETETTTAYEAGHFNSGAMDYGDHSLEAVKNGLRPLGIFIHTSAVTGL